MPNGLITLPLRLWLRGAQLALGATERAAGLAWSAARPFVPGAGGGSSNGHRGEHERPYRREPESDEDTGSVATAEAPDAPVRDPRAEFELEDPRVPSREPPPEPEVRSEEPAPAPEPPPAAEHVDTEPTLVESFAEAGAEDGAGAQIRIDEPWEGYGALHADEVVARLADASAAELAAVELYEAATRGRKTVINAVEQELAARAASPGETAGPSGR